MKIRLKYLLLIVVGVLFISLTTASVALAEVSVIANKGITTNSITPKEAKKIWLGKKKSMPGGGVVKMADLPVGNDTRKFFYKKIVKKKEKQLKAYWAKIIFTGKGFPPKMFDSDEDVLEWVANTPGAMGYVSSDSVDGSVNVLLKK